MYKPLANSISENLKQGIAILPAESQPLSIKKIALEQFFAIDYRTSNPVLLAMDSESHTNYDPLSISSDDKSSYILGFAMVRNVETIAELATLPQAAKTRLKNKIFNTIAKTLNVSHVRKNRGQRAVYVNKSGNYPNQATVDAVGVSLKNTSSWQLVPFLISTSIFYNNFRANLRFGEKDSELGSIYNDAQTRLHAELEIVREKLNQKLATPITESLLAKIFLVSPEDIMEEKYVSDIFEYVDSKFISAKKTKSLVDKVDDDDAIPIPGVSLGSISKT